jgi:hypothetical protein
MSAPLRFAVVPAALLALAPAARAGFANEYAVFGNRALTFAGFAKVAGGPAGSNGDVIHQAGSGHFDSLRGGGSLNPAPPTAWNARQNVAGDVVFNNNVNINQLSTVNGSVSAGGYANVATVLGGVVANGPVSVSIYNDIGAITSGANVTLSNGVNVAGNVGANGDVSAGLSVNIGGTVTLTGSYTQGSFSSNGGVVNGSVNPQPKTYTPVALPPATTFTSGGQNVTLNTFNDVTLAPGKYGALSLAGSTDLHLDLTHGPINVFVTGDVDFRRIRPIVNGGDYKLVDPALAGGVYLESHGNISMTGEFFGALYAPTGDVTTGTIGAVTGSILAGRDAIIGSATSIEDGSTTYVASEYLAAAVAAVPEPTGAVTFGIVGVVTLAGRRRRHR